MGASDDLIALYWTTSGPVEVHFGREWSLFDLRDRCEQAARVGFKGIGIWHADLEHVLETRTLREVRQILDDHGMEQLELEFLGDWFLEPDDERRRGSDERRALLFEAAAELPAHHVKVGNIVGTDCELPRIVEAFGELCADAARHTDAKVVYEFMPYDVNVNDVDKALAVVEGADASNGGLAFDTWHLGKLRLEPDELRRIPPRFVSWVELCDGPYEYAEDRLDEVINRRRLPGEGEFPIVEYVSVFRELGYNGPWGVEVLSEELRNLPIAQIFDRAYETTSAQLELSKERSLGV
jgi:sugar phosphate isomerase/epimerase